MPLNNLQAQGSPQNKELSDPNVHSVQFEKPWVVEVPCFSEAREGQGGLLEADQSLGKDAISWRITYQNLVTQEKDRFSSETAAM